MLPGLAPCVANDRDQHWTSVELLLHFDGVDGSTTFSDSSMRTRIVTRGGDAQIDTSQSKWGGASGLFDGSGDFLTCDGSSGFAFGTGDFTIEMFVRLPSVSGNHTLYDGRAASNNTLSPTILVSSSSLRFFAGTANRIVGTATLAVNTWYHVALSRSGTSSKMFLNGVQDGPTFIDSLNYVIGATRPMIGGGGFGNGIDGNELNGWIDELRVTKGVARYVANFPPPTRAFASR